jgi:hypothetical protein
MKNDFTYVPKIKKIGKCSPSWDGTYRNCRDCSWKFIFCTIFARKKLSKALSVIYLGKYYPIMWQHACRHYGRYVITSIYRPKQNLADMFLGVSPPGNLADVFFGHRLK